MLLTRSEDLPLDSRKAYHLCYYLHLRRKGKEISSMSILAPAGRADVMRIDRTMCFESKLSLKVACSNKTFLIDVKVDVEEMQLPFERNSNP